MVRFWGVRMGRRGKYVDLGYKGEYIGIGWRTLAEDAGDFSVLVKSGKLKEAYIRNYPNDSQLSQTIGYGQIRRFVDEIKIGDAVLVPDVSRRKVLMGRITGPNLFRNQWDDECPYLNRRKVKWIKIVKRDRVPEKLKNSLGALLTVFNIDSRAEQIQELIGKTPSVPKKKERLVAGEDISEIIVDRLFNLTPREFEEFVQHILSIVGFEAATTSYVADGGVDVVGKLNTEGLAEVNLRVQVKRTKGKTGVGDILKVRGALGADDHGAVISLSGFTKKATEEAEEAGKKPILLVDGKEFAELLLKHFEELDERYNEVLKIKKRELSIWDQYYAKT